MAKEDIIEKLKKSGLTGRSGSGFLTGLKWEMVKKAKAKKKYIVCNGSEGEVNVFKDRFILENYPGEVVSGVKLALKTIGNAEAIIYLRKDYYQKFKPKLAKLIKGLPITIMKKKGGYLGGEETSICESIEGNRPEPRIRPPYPTEAGIFGLPTLINNVETFYTVSKIAKGEYKNTRFYCVAGDVKHKGVFNLPESWTIEKILKETKNWPDFDFFAQVGGGASGDIYLPKELNQKVNRLAGIIIFNRRKTDPVLLMRKWADFYHKENCDKCAPCREGVFRIREMLENKNLDKETFEDIFLVLKETSFCALGKSVPGPFQLITKLGLWKKK